MAFLYIFLFYDRIFCRANYMIKEHDKVFKTIKDVLKTYSREDIVIAEHVSDPHLGFNGSPSKYNEFKPLRVERQINGQNARTIDVNDAFKQTIDIALEFGKDFLEKPGVDIYLNGGDGFDKNGFKLNFIETFYTKQYLRLTKAEIPIVEIVGNHNFPSEKGQGCHLERVALHEGIRVVYRGFYEMVEFPEMNVVVHCVPSTHNQKVLDGELAKVERIDGKINIGLGHWGVTTIKHYAENQDKSLVVDLDRVIACRMDYFALADYHKPMDLGHNIHYAGSIERLGADEIDNKPQVKIVAFDKKTGECLCVEPVYLNVRPMEKYIVDCEGKTIEVINAEISKTLKTIDVTDKIIILKILKIPREMKRLLNHQEMRELTKTALAFDLDIERVDRLKNVQSSGQVSKRLGIIEGWEPFAKKIPADGSFDKDFLIRKGYQILQRVVEDEA